MATGGSSLRVVRETDARDTDRCRPLGNLFATWPVDRGRKVVTERFVVRSPIDTDANGRVLAWFQDAAFRRSFPSYNPPKTIAELGSRFQSEFREIRRTLVITDGEEPIGLLWVDLAGVNFVTTHHLVGERRWWGKGVIHEARAAVINALFRSGAQKVIGKPSADNKAVVQTYRDQGFVEEGRLRQERRTAEGGRTDAIYFGLLASEWDYSKARQLPAVVQQRLARIEQKCAKSPERRIVVDPVFENLDKTHETDAMAEQANTGGHRMLFIDGIATATLNGGVVRIQLSQVGADGQQKAAGELAIPVSKYAEVLQGLQHIAQQLNEQREESRKQQDTKRSDAS